MAFGGFDSQGGPMRPMAEINTTPLVDVMLVLLVIFIITAPLLTHAIRLDLPSAQAPVSTETPETVTVSIDAKEQLFWNDAPLTDAQALRERLAGIAQRTPQPELHLRADQQVRYQRIAEVMSAAQSAGVTKIGFVTDPKPAPR
ncbi:MAG: ExbD/TolR family protein [Burkholderiales bacterium]|jgi:biopolymer transport protein ExbD